MAALLQCDFCRDTTVRADEVSDCVVSIRTAEERMGANAYKGEEGGQRADFQLCPGCEREIRDFFGPHLNRPEKC